MPEPSSSPDPLSWLEGELKDLGSAGLRRQLRTRSGRQTSTTNVDGQSLVNFSANDYLGLAADPRVVEAAARAASDAGWGSGASPLVTGRSDWHARLEQRLAEFEGVDSALLFPTGFAANAGVIPALVDEGDVIFADAKNHASIIDGCRLARAKRYVYPHNDIGALSKLLCEQTGFRRRLIVTDSLFSMDGDFAPLDELATLATHHNAMLMVDEAHATGVWGAGGRGVIEHFAATCPAVEQAAIIRVGTLSKALGSVGGFVAGSQSLIDWLANRARSYVFSTATPAATAAAGCVALDLVEAEPHRRQRLHQLARTLRERLNDEGWNTGDSTSQIIPIFVGDPTETMRLAAGLSDAGLLVPGIRPPSVPPGESLLRVSLSCEHTEDDLDRLIRALSRLRK